METLMLSLGPRLPDLLELGSYLVDRRADQVKAPGRRVTGLPPLGQVDTEFQRINVTVGAFGRELERVYLGLSGTQYLVGDA